MSPEFVRKRKFHGDNVVDSEYRVFISADRSHKVCHIEMFQVPIGAAKCCCNGCLAVEGEGTLVSCW